MRKVETSRRRKHLLNKKLEEEVRVKIIFLFSVYLLKRITSRRNKRLSSGSSKNLSAAEEARALLVLRPQQRLTGLRQL